VRGDIAPVRGIVAVGFGVGPEPSDRHIGASDRVHDESIAVRTLTHRREVLDRIRQSACMALSPHEAIARTSQNSDYEVVMRIIRWLDEPAARFIRASDW
jgi:hypothetical protein